MSIPRLRMTRTALGWSGFGWLPAQRRARELQERGEGERFVGLRRDHVADTTSRWFDLSSQLAGFCGRGRYSASALHRRAERAQRHHGEQACVRRHDGEAERG